MPVPRCGRQKRRGGDCEIDLGPNNHEDRTELIGKGWPSNRICLLATGLHHLPPPLTHLTGLTSLDLAYNGIGDEGLRDLANGPIAASLRCLWLYGNKIQTVPDELLRSRDAQAIFDAVRGGLAFN